MKGLGSSSISSMDAVQELYSAGSQNTCAVGMVLSLNTYSKRKQTTNEHVPFWHVNGP